MRVIIILFIVFVSSTVSAEKVLITFDKAGTAITYPAINSKKDLEPLDKFYDRVFSDAIGSLSGDEYVIIERSELPKFNNPESLYLDDGKIKVDKKKDKEITDRITYAKKISKKIKEIDRSEAIKKLKESGELPEDYTENGD